MKLVKENNMKGVKVRRSVSNDVYFIRRVQQEIWLDTYPNEEYGITREDILSKFKDDNNKEGRRKLEERKKRYADKNMRTWVAEINNKIVGFCISSKGEHHNRLRAIYVLPSFQGYKIGSLLIKRMFEWLGYEKDVFLNVVVYNKKAIRFYQKHGFRLTGKRVVDSAVQLPTGKVMPEVEMVRRSVLQ